MDHSSCRSEDVKKQEPLPHILKFPFIKEVVRHLINCSQYKYLTIITDGAINPNPNQTRYGIPRNNLMIEFDNGDVWKIEESIWNLNVEGYGALYFTNLNCDLAIGSTPCNGYGNIKLILSTIPHPQYITHIQPPHFCINGSLNGGANIERWAGKWGFNAGWLLLIPYIPLGYKDLRLQINLSQNYTYIIRQYCCNNIIYCETTGDAAANTPTCINIPLFSDRIYFQLINADIGVGTFCFQGTWIRKGKF